jgi:hypothetical protein
MIMITQYLQNPENTLRPRRYGGSRSRLGMLPMFARLIWPTLFCLHAEKAALEDGLINALQHRSIRSFAL